MDVCWSQPGWRDEEKEGRRKGGRGEMKPRGGSAGDQTGFPQFCGIVRKAARIEPSRPECGLIDLSCFYGRGFTLPVISGDF